MTKCAKCHTELKEDEIRECIVCKQVFCWLHSLPYEHDQICSSEDYQMTDLHGSIVKSSDTANKVLKKASPFLPTSSNSLKKVASYQCSFCDLFIPKIEAYNYVSSRFGDGTPRLLNISCSKCYKVRGSPANWTKI